MKTRNLFGIFMLFLCIATLTGCDNDEKGERKVIGYEEYVLTVASAKVPGIVTSCGNNQLTDVYAVKKEASTEWEAFQAIIDFTYEPGYEYRIRISETNYLDHNMGEPAWTEYKLLDVISKEEKDSENLPSNFIPNWYYEEYCAHISKARYH